MICAKRRCRFKSRITTQRGKRWIERRRKTWSDGYIRSTVNRARWMLSDERISTIGRKYVLSIPVLRHPARWFCRGNE